VAKAKRNGSNAYLDYQRREDFLIERIDSRAEKGNLDEERTQPVRIEKDGARVWEF
jgi:hypothetical protein